MTAPTPDPRHRAVETIERGLMAMAGEPPAYLARALVTRLEAAGLVIRDATPQRPWGRCEFHELPQPCAGCAGDAKAKHDAEEAT
jgi:hypothetical protein